MIFKSLDFWNKAFIKGWCENLKHSCLSFFGKTVLHKSSRKTISKNDFWLRVRGAQKSFFEKRENGLHLFQPQEPARGRGEIRASPYEKLHQKLMGAVPYDISTASLFDGVNNCFFQNDFWFGFGVAKIIFWKEGEWPSSFPTARASVPREDFALSLSCGHAPGFVPEWKTKNQSRHEKWQTVFGERET